MLTNQFRPMLLINNATNLTACLNMEVTVPRPRLRPPKKLALGNAPLAQCSSALVVYLVHVSIHLVIYRGLSYVNHPGAIFVGGTGALETALHEGRRDFHSTFPVSTLI
jgi:hypothetical protein